VLARRLDADMITPPLANLQEESFKMDVFLPACQYLHPGAKFMARIQQWGQALAISEEATTFFREILKFLGIVALILVNALILLMAG
jgi:hypothetical protein